MIVKDEWLSNYFPKGAYAFIPTGEVSSVANHPGFISAKISVKDTHKVNALIKNGFELIETALLWEQQRKKELQISDIHISFAQPSNAEVVAAIASQAFRCSRFHQDSKISNKVASRIKTDWVLNYFKGLRGNSMIVARKKENILGFLLLINNTTIDLIAVSSNSLKQGIASRMIEFANIHFGLLRAGNQIINEASINLYQRSGFILKSAQYVLHRH